MTSERRTAHGRGGLCHTVVAAEYVVHVLAVGADPNGRKEPFWRLTTFCGVKLRANRFWEGGRVQRVVGLEERCRQCSWDVPPETASFMTEREIAYLQCVIEDKKRAAVWAGAMRGKSHEELKEVASSPSHRVWSAKNEIEEVSRAWGWGVDRRSNRLRLAHQVSEASRELGDGDDELLAAQAELDEAKALVGPARQALDAARKRVSAAEVRIENLRTRWTRVK